MKNLRFVRVVGFFQVFREKKRRGLIRLRRWQYRNKNSWPFLSGDAFAEVADYSPYGSNGTKTPQISRLLAAESIFIPAHMIFDFTKEYGDFVQARILITGNSDQNFTSWPNLPASIKIWLGQNLALPHCPNVEAITIPIGLENLSLGRSGLPNLIMSKSKRIVDRVLVPPMAMSNPIRREVLNKMANGMKPFDIFTEYLGEKPYFKLTSKYQFVLCLEGNGFENHRIWETLYRDAFPVVLRTPWSSTLEHLNAPILFIDSIEECTEKLLMEFNNVNLGYNSRDTEKLWMNYWSKFIQHNKRLS